MKGPEGSYEVSACCYLLSDPLRVSSTAIESTIMELFYGSFGAEIQI